MKFNNFAKNGIPQLTRRKDRRILAYKNGDFWSRFSMRFFENMCIDANFDVSYLSQGSRFFNSVECLCNRITRILRITKKQIIWSRPYSRIQKIACIGLILWGDVKYQNRCSLWFSSKSETGSWKMQSILII